MKTENRLVVDKKAGVVGAAGNCKQVTLCISVTMKPFHILVVAVAV